MRNKILMMAAALLLMVSQFASAGDQRHRDRYLVGGALVGLAVGAAIANDRRGYDYYDDRYDHRYDHRDNRRYERRLRHYDSYRPNYYHYNSPYRSHGYQRHRGRVHQSAPGYYAPQRRHYRQW